MKNKKISQAEREKQELEKKLEYLNRSIQSIRSYDYATATANPADHDPPDRSPLDLQ
jgi:peptidoglycan hydrolase CwlO-like protein